MIDTREEASLKLANAIKTALADARREGREEGLSVAEKIVAWLTPEPDEPKFAEVRKWANAEIQRMRLRNG